LGVEIYRLAAYATGKRKPIYNAEYVTLPGLNRGILRAIHRGADTLLIRKCTPNRRPPQ